MKNSICTFCSLILLLTAAQFEKATGQITVTAADFSSSLAVGNSLISHSDTITTFASIGSPGSTANSWDFSTLETHKLDTLQSVTPSATPYIGWFPGATHTLKTRRTVMNITGTVYQYLTLGTNLLNRGNGGSGPFLFGTATLKTTNTPSQISYQLPMTVGTTWTSAYVESLLVTYLGLPVYTKITSYATTNTVDAFGTMTLPGAFGSHPALRIRSDTRFNGTGGFGRTISYQFIAGNGASVQVAAVDTLQPSAGVIHVDSSYTSWNGSITTGVDRNELTLHGFALLQNYPNPFNPSTCFQFTVDRAQIATLKIFDFLGREVATLVNGEVDPGTHSVEWNAAEFASGVYLCRLQAGSSTITRKVTLVR